MSQSFCLRNMHVIAASLLAGALLTLAASTSSLAASLPGLRVAVTGPAQPVFLWQSMRCEEWDIPDTAARAWRDAGGRVHLVASSSTNRAMVGPDLDHLKQDCRVIFKGGNQDSPAAYDDRSWLSASYTLDGDTVFALVHNEFHGHLRPALCPSRDYMQCWANAVTFAQSRDGGFSFTHAPAPGNFVAGLPYPYRGDLGHRSGYFNPSNILQRDGFYYAFFWAEAQGAQQRGACLMRSADLGDPSAWRAWDGKSFSIRFQDPYLDKAAGDAAHICAPVGAGSLVAVVSSVTRDRKTGLYLALMAAASTGSSPVPGIYASTSTDLIEWSPPALVRQAPLLFKYDCADRDAMAYPALLDPVSPSRNFEDSADRAYIYVTVLHVAACKLGPNRDLVRLPVSITATG